MEFISNKDIYTLSNPGINSHQLLSPRNSNSEHITLTRVEVAPGVTQPRHMHETSEKIWIALAGIGQLLLTEGKTQVFKAGGVARFERGDTHGLFNDSSGVFEYMSVTSPPIVFGYAYKDSNQ